MLYGRPTVAKMEIWSYLFYMKMVADSHLQAEPLKDPNQWMICLALVVFLFLTFLFQTQALQEIRILNLRVMTFLFFASLII